MTPTAGDTVAIDSESFPALERGTVKRHPTPGSTFDPANVFCGTGEVLVVVKPYGPQGGDVVVALRADELELLEAAPPPAPQDDGDDWSDQLTGYAAMAAAAVAGGGSPW